MSLYVIEDRYGALRDSSVNYNYAKSLQQSRYPSCHIVELVPAKPKVQVSQEEADMLEKAKHPTLRPSFMITEYSNSHKGNILGNGLEDRLMCAYVNGYTVAQEKKYNVKVFNSFEGFLYVYKDYVMLSARVDDSRGQFTQKDIDELKQRDDIPLDWDKVKLIEVDDESN